MQRETGPMPDFEFQVEAAEPQRRAATPLFFFKLRIREVPATRPPTAIHSIVLNCQIRIEPARRRYSPGEQQRLRELFDVPERWGQTLRPFLWTQASVYVPSFTGAGSADLPVPCSSDFCLAASKYFSALEQGDIPLCFLFSGTFFYRTETHAVQVGQIPWDKEAYFRLPASAWRDLMDLYYPNSAWMCLRKDVFDRLNSYRSQLGLPTWELALERLLAVEEERVQS
jgi:hypothetical protein